MRWWSKSSTDCWKPPLTSATSWTSTSSTTNLCLWDRLWRWSYSEYGVQFVNSHTGVWKMKPACGRRRWHTQIILCLLQAAGEARKRWADWTLEEDCKDSGRSQGSSQQGEFNLSCVYGSTINTFSNSAYLPAIHHRPMTLFHSRVPLRWCPLRNGLRSSISSIKRPMKSNRPEISQRSSWWRASIVTSLHSAKWAQTLVSLKEVFSSKSQKSHRKKLQ